MQIIYKSFDDLLFDSEEECLNHENSIIHSNLFSIIFYDNRDYTYKIRKNNIYDDDIYQHCEKIIIHNDNELDDFTWLAEECGWSEFEQIISPGSWKRISNNFREGTWVKE